MSWFERLRRWCCTHQHRVRERREVQGVTGVVTLVCERCGDQVPLVRRTASEYIDIQTAGRILPLRRLS